MTSLTTPKETGRGADIPKPRAGQGVRLLVLGADEDARLLREKAVAAGYELAQRYSARVSHVAYGEGVDPRDGRYAKIRDAGLTLVPLQACAAQLGLAAIADTDVEPEADTGSGEQAEPEPMVTVESENELDSPERYPDSDDFYEDDELDEPGGPDPLAYPPLPEEDPAEEYRDDAADGGGEAVDTDAQRDGAVATVDEHGDQEALVEDAADVEELPLAAAVIGIDPWPDIESLRTTDTSTIEAAAQESVTTTEPGEVTASAETVDEIITTAGDASQASETVASAPGRVLLSFIWALIPLASLGLLTPVVFGYAAVRTRSRLYAAATLGYALAVVAAFALSAIRPENGSTSNGSGGLLTFALAMSWLGGTGHALSVRPRVFFGGDSGESGGSAEACEG